MNLFSSIATWFPSFCTAVAWGLVAVIVDAFLQPRARRRPAGKPTEEIVDAKKAA